MSDALWTQAKADLIVQPPGGPVDAVVWEHAARVTRTAEFIAALPEAATLTVDRLALRAASLYHDVGWIVQMQEGVVSPRELLQRPTSDIQRELAADWLEQRVAALLTPGSLQRATRAIRQCNDRRTDLAEARILCDAENLDQVGPQSLWLGFRKLLCEGRTSADLVAAWDRQEEYHYWQARIKECFHFPSVRALAERRYASMQRLMTEFRSGVLLDDLRPTPPAGSAGGRGKSAEVRA